MKNTVLSLIVASLSSLAVAGSPQAPFTSPRIAPTVPTSADAVTYSVDFFGCGYLYEPQISRSGQTITIRQELSAICGIPQSGLSEHYALGNLPSGTYTIHLEVCDPGFTPCASFPSPNDLTFAVIGGTIIPESAPASGALSIFIAIALLAAFGAARARARSV